MPTYLITYSTSSDSDGEILDSEENSFNNIEEGIEYIIANTTGSINESYHNEPDRAVILLDTIYYDKDGNEITDINADLEDLNSVNYLAEIELIEESR